MSKFVCAMPWSAITVTTTGDIKPCCVYQGSWGKYERPEDLNSSYLGTEAMLVRRDILLGNIPRGCQGCAQKDAQGFPSKRRKYQERLEREGKIVDTSSLEPDRLLFAEVAISNSCNLACVTCDSEFSSRWVNIDKELVGRFPFRQHQLDRAHTFGMKYEAVPVLMEMAKRAELGIELIGGEPLYHKTTLDFLNYVDPDSPISITTNLTTLADGYQYMNVLPVLQRLKNLTLNVSIDGVGPVYEFIRGFSYENIKRALDRVLTIDVRAVLINPCVSLYNIFDLPNIIREMSEYGKLRFNTMVYEPHYMSVHLLSRRTRDELGSELIQYASGINNNIGQKQYRDLIQYLETAPEETDPKVFARFHAWTDEMARRRKIDLRKLEPRLQMIGK